MPLSDPRFTIHSVSVQQIEPSAQNPRKRLSHAIKATPSATTAGVLQPIKRRATFTIGIGLFGGLRKQ